MLKKKKNSDKIENPLSSLSSLSRSGSSRRQETSLGRFNLRPRSRVRVLESNSSSRRRFLALLGSEVSGDCFGGKYEIGTDGSVQFRSGIEHMKGMTDWSLCELEDIDWIDFGKSDDHIVPRQGFFLVDESVAVSDTCKKARHEVGNDAGKSMCSRASATKTLLLRKEEACLPHPMKDESSSILEGSRSHAYEIAVPATCDRENVAHATALGSQESEISDNCAKDCYDSTNQNKHCSKDPSTGSTFPLSGSNSCHSSIKNVSSDDTGLPFLENGQKGKESDLLYDDWPEIGNFDDIDTMFRNWDSSFEQGHTGSADELSWFSSSSQAIYGSEINLEPGDHDKPSYAAWLDTNDEDKGKTSPKKEECDGRDMISSLPPTQMSSVLSELEASKMMRSQISTEEKRMNQLADQKPLVSDIVDPPKQKHFTESAASNYYMSTVNPHAQLEYRHLAHQVSFAQTSSSMELNNDSKSSSYYKASDHVANNPTCVERLPDKLSMHQTMDSRKFEKQHQKQQFCDTTIFDPNQQSTLRGKPSVRNKRHTFQHKTGGDSKLQNICMELPMVEIDPTIVQENSCVTSGNISPEAGCFRQLQDVMHQLDVRTKLCLRDSLYRLARSAKQRRTCIDDCSRESSCTGGIHGAEAADKYADLMDVETDTNPIDRSIAHLLFHKPLEPVTKSANDAISHESHITIEQLHVNIDEEVLMPDEFDHPL